jgi:ABC-2 type transport system permease protein
VKAATLPTIRDRGGAARMVGNETVKSLRLVWSYRATLVPTLLSLSGMYLVFQYFVGGGRIVDDLVADTAPGMFAYVVAYLATMRLVAGILEERNAGTLEQIHLSPLPAWMLAAGRLAAVMIEALLVATAVTVAVLVALGVDYPLDAQALVPVALMLAGVAGFALLIGAVSFTYPGIGALVHVIQMAIMMLNGMIVVPELFPRWLEVVAKLMPSTLGIGVTRRVLVERATLGDLWADGALAWLILHTVALIGVGWVAYQWQVRRALRDGRLGPA